MNPVTVVLSEFSASVTTVWIRVRTAVVNKMPAYESELRKIFKIYKSLSII